ncbi:MAG: PKD domain-containing protein [Nitrospira sp.]|nr:PKD domain-containing protein [Nitrospira sp.]
MFTFDGLSSVNAEQFTWNFGDGIEVSGPRSTHATVSHTYSCSLVPSQGSASFTVILTVSNAFGVTHTISRSIQIQGPNPPDAAIVVSTTLPIVNELVTFDGSGSFDPDNDPLTFLWDFEDGASATGTIVSHSFSQPGTFTITLTVTDTAFLSDTQTVTITVSP